MPYTMAIYADEDTPIPWLGDLFRVVGIETGGSIPAGEGVRWLS